MSPQLPRVNAAQVVRILEKLGFELTRQSGSHRIYKNSVGKRVTVPFHARKILHPKVLKSIIIDTGLSTEEFIRLLKGS